MIPVIVKLCESPSKAGGLLMIASARGNSYARKGVLLIR